MARMGVRFNEDEVWLWYHHLENCKKLKLSKGDYCTRYGLDRTKYGNMQYVVNYCKEKSRSRYNRMMAILDEFDKADGEITIVEFCRSKRISNDDFYVAQRHREYTWFILKRIAENHPIPELIEAPVAGEPELDVNLADRELATQEVAITDDYALERKRELLESIIPELIPITPEMLEELEPNPEVTREPIINPEKLDEEVVKPKLTLSDFISKRKLSENLTPDEPSDEKVVESPEEPINNDSELDESSDEEVAPPAKKGRKPKVLESEVIDEPKEPIKFFALNSPPVSQTIDEGIGQVGVGNWSDKPLAPNVQSEPEINLKGNRIELTFTKTVRLTAAPDTPPAQLLDIINLLKDL